MVELFLTLPRGAASTPRPSRSARIPSFIGRRVSVDDTWVSRHHMSLTAHLGALNAGGAARLLGNFVVVAQRPAAGYRGSSLTVWGRQPELHSSPPPTIASPPTTGVSASAPPVTTALPPPSPPETPEPYYQNPVYWASAFPDPSVLDNGDTHSDFWAFATGSPHDISSGEGSAPITDGAGAGRRERPWRCR